MLTIPDTFTNLFPLTTQWGSIPKEKNLDLDLVHLLVDIVDSGSLTRAAARRGVTRSQISKSLAKLEGQAGADLLRRSTRHLELTAQGALLYEHGVRILRELEAAKEGIDDLAGSIRGHLRVSVPWGLGDVFLGQVLLDFLALHPRVTMDVSFSNRVQDLIAAEIDVALRITSAPPLESVARDLGPVEWHLYASPRYLANTASILHPNDLAHCAFLSIPTPSRRCVLRLQRDSEDIRIELAPHLQSQHFMFLVRAAVQGMGIGAFASYMAEGDVRAGRLVRVLPDWALDGFGGHLYAITTASQLLPRATQVLLDHLRNRIRGHSLDGLGDRAPLEPKARLTAQ
ncbi:transcriptional regulator, LysR family [Burkholderia sp. YR290]|nr:transcriptional regulator, LysR family [Burkholderia sp. YR290]